MKLKEHKIFEREYFIVITDVMFFAYMEIKIDDDFELSFFEWCNMTSP